MKKVTVLLILAIIQTGFGQMFDEKGIRAIMQNDQLLDSIINCFLDIGICTPLGSYAKALISGIIFTNCGWCSDNQKKTLAFTIRLFMQLRPNEWKGMLNKFDPDGKLEGEVQEFMRSYE